MLWSELDPVICKTQLHQAIEPYDLLEIVLTFPIVYNTNEWLHGSVSLGDYMSIRSHEIKRCLLLRRKVMTQLDSILKSRDITLPSKVHTVKAMVFPVAMYRCESWTIKKAECQTIDALNCGAGEDS